MRLIARASVIAVVALASTAVGAAPLPPPSPVPQPTAPQAPAPAYQPQLLRLAELLGTLAYMSDLCGAPDAAAWRTRMAALLASEGQTPGLRDLLTGSFNRGFRSYEASYRVCTPNAQLVIGRTLDEAGRLAGTVVTRFGAT